MNDNNSVPARIVIVGTSTMKLSDRFNQFGFDNPSGKQYSAAPAYGNMSTSRSVAPPDYGGAYGGMASNRFAEPRSFLFDDYMENDLYGSAVPQERSLPSFQSNRSVTRSRNEFGTPYVDEYDNPDDSYEQEVAPRFSRRPNNFQRHARNEPRYVMVPANNVRYRRPAQRARPSASVQEVYEYYEPIPRPARGKAKVINVPIQNRISFKRPQRAAPQRFRNVGRSPVVRKGQNASPIKKRVVNTVNRRRPIMKGRVNKTRNAGPPMKAKKPKLEPRKKVTTEELNRELETYMRSGKHPRIEPA